MFHSMYLDERVSVTPSEMNAIHSAEEINDMIHRKLVEQHEKTCNANGYILPDSLELLARSSGAAENGRFTGNFMYDCKFKCTILYPTAQTVVSGVVLKINDMGAYAVYKNAIRILLARDSHIGNAEFETLQEGSTVNVRIDRSRFQTKDAYIMAVGTLVSVVPEEIVSPTQEVISSGSSSDSSSS